jgi:hypothetical protein
VTLVFVWHLLSPTVSGANRGGRTDYWQLNKQDRKTTSLRAARNGWCAFVDSSSWERPHSATNGTAITLKHSTINPLGLTSWSRDASMPPSPIHGIEFLILGFSCGWPILRQTENTRAENAQHDRWDATLHQNSTFPSFPTRFVQIVWLRGRSDSAVGRAVKLISCMVQPLG